MTEKYMTASSVMKERREITKNLRGSIIFDGHYRKFFQKGEQKHGQEEFQRTEISKNASTGRSLFYPK
jgi:hypothetical protein